MWVLKTLEKKNVTQVERWFNDEGDSFTMSIGWRWGTATYDNKPDIDEEDQSEEDQVNVYSVGDVNGVDLDDGCWDEWEFSEGISEEERERIQEKYNEEGGMALEEEGWYCDDYDVYFAGPLELTEEE